MFEVQQTLGVDDYSLKLETYSLVEAFRPSPEAKCLRLS